MDTAKPAEGPLHSSAALSSWPLGAAQTEQPGWQGTLTPGRAPPTVQVWEEFPLHFLGPRSPGGDAPGEKQARPMTAGAELS